VGLAKVRCHSHQTNLDVMGSWGLFGASPSIKGSSAHSLLLLTNAHRPIHTVWYIPTVSLFYEIFTNLLRLIEQYVIVSPKEHYKENYIQIAIQLENTKITLRTMNTVMLCYTKQRSITRDSSL